MKLNYPGNGSGKRKARHRLYASIIDNINKDGSTDVVTLAGPGAHEVPYLRDVLQTNPKHAWFVDTNLSCVKDAKAQWPQAQAYHGDLVDFMHCGHVKLRFCHLDLMGAYTGKTRRCAKALSPHLVDDAIVALTFSRGRDSQVPAIREVKDRYNGDIVKQRWDGVIRAFRDDLNKDFSILDNWSYANRSAGTPSMGMSVLVVQITGKKSKGELELEFQEMGNR